MLHARAFRASVVWTLALLFLGSVVHATESSLACPDWPTCYGTMVPEMTGGIFWEHLHRLVAGSLLLFWCVATWLARKEVPARPWVFRAALGGVALLVVQSVFGGLTVLYRLPDLVSTTHLALALTFLVLATILASATGETVEASPPNLASGGSGGPHAAGPVRRFAAVVAGLVFVQSVLGGLVRHMDAGMACPDAPLCLGQVIPPLINVPIAIHFSHRVLGILVAASACLFAAWVVRNDSSPRLRRWVLGGAVLAIIQVALGFASVLTVLAVAPVSLHTLVAASLLAVLTRVAMLDTSRVPHVESRPAPAPTA